MPNRLLDQDMTANSQEQLQLASLPTNNSTGRLPSNNSLAMLKMLENFRLSAQKTQVDSKDSKISNKKRRVAPQGEDLARHDGLLVDYSKFSDLTKEVLKNANVLRQKSIKSPVRDFPSPNTRNAYVFSQNRSRQDSPSFAAGGHGFSIPPMSARVSSPTGSTTSNHLVRRKVPETPSNMVLGGRAGSGKDTQAARIISKSRPFESD